MKKLCFILSFVLLSFNIFAQSGKRDVANAYNHYGNGYLDRAKTAIDKAITFEDTKNDAKTWMYRGNIYLLLASTDDPSYKNLCSNCAEIAYEAYMKALELDKKISVSMQIATPTMGLRYCASILYNEAIEKINSKKLDEALVLAQKAYRSDPSNEPIVYLYGLTAELNDKKDIAKKVYQELLEKKAKMIEPYSRLANIYKEENDTVNALKAIEQRAKNFPDSALNVTFAVEQSILWMWAGRTEEATNLMNKALEKDPENYSLLINYGTQMTQQKQYAEAEKYLLKAIELKPNDIYAIYNLGNSYYNNYVEIMKTIDDIEDDALYQKAREDAQQLLRKALPYLEKAHEIDPNDRETLIMLKTIYPRIDASEDERAIFNEKMKAVDEKL